MKFKEMHRRLDVELLPESYEKLIKFCCDSLKVHLALDIVDEICEAGLSLPTETLNYICRACEDDYEFILVRRIHSMLHQHNLRPNSETFRSIINLMIRMKDFDNAYAMLKDLERFDLMPTASMYNAIIAGYYREKNMNGVLRVLGQMKQADVKPDSQTFSYLINNSTSEEDIIKYFEELKCAGVQVTKQIFMALINAYAASGQFEKAKQVVLDKAVPVKYLNEVKSTLVSTLASHGRISDALDIYMEIKHSGSCLEPKAIISLIEHWQFEGELSILLQLLEELNDPYYWVDGCNRVILHCIRNRDISSSVDLLKKLAEHLQDDEMAREVVFDEVFSHIADMDPADLQFGMNFLEAIKKNLKLHPSRKCLDFLLSACVNAKDLCRSQLVWKEYEAAGLPYNILSYLRMYQAFLASGSFKAASKFLSQLPKDDPHVQLVIRACGVTYGKPKARKKSQTK